MKIATGYLTGNLTCEWDTEACEYYDEAASQDRYGELLRAALEKQFPGAEITVGSQDAVGAIPIPLKTAVYDDDGRENDALAAEVDDCHARVYEAGDWMVKRSPMYITLTNEFHNSEARVRVASLHTTLTHSQYQRACRKLCGNADCQCQTIKCAYGPDGQRLEWHNDGDAEGRATITIDGEE